MEKRWWKECVVYQIYPRSFKDSNGDGIGDLQGIIEKLDYLQWLGIDVVWLSPVYQSPNDDNGYDISDYFTIMNEFGTIEDIEGLITELHLREMKLVMDLVVNHTSDEHPWFIESRSSKDNPYRDYYIWRQGKDGGPPNNWGSWFGGPAWEYDPATAEYYLHIFSRKQPDLNWANRQVREEIYKMMIWWLDQGIDGFRMDVINLISKDREFPEGKKGSSGKFGDGSPYYVNGPRVHEYLKEMNQRVLAGYDIMTVGETPGITPEEGVKYVNRDRDELNMIFQFDIVELDRGSSKWELKDWQLTDLKDVFTRWWEVLKDKGWNSIYLNNHDQPRVVSRFGDEGDYWKESAKLLATMSHTLPGTPYIYQGEEIGMTNVKFSDITDYQDIETLNWYREMVNSGRDAEEIMRAVHRASRDNARTPVQWDESENAGFTTGTPWLKVNSNYKEINVRDQQEAEDSILNYYRRLINLRKDKKNQALIYGDYRLLMKDSQQIYAYLRELNEDRLLIMLNFSADKALFTTGISLKGWELLLANYPQSGNQLPEEILRPYEARVYRLIN